MSIIVKSPGLLTTVQDIGCYGFQKYGVSTYGPMDKKAFQLANILVGNDREEASFEITIMGPTLLFTENCVIAVVGADLGLLINNMQVEHNASHMIHAGDFVSFWGCKSGCRAYLSVRGGIKIEKIMNSASTMIKSKVGGYKGRPLQCDDMLELAYKKAMFDDYFKRKVNYVFTKESKKEIRVILGPQDDRFTKEGMETFLTEPYGIGIEFDRMGYRLEGSKIEHIAEAGIISDGNVFGAIQVPGDGKPIIMMADCASVGGYTKIATIISIDIPEIAQSKTGDKIYFKKIEIDEAQELYINEQKYLNDIEEKMKIIGNSISEKEYSITINDKQYSVLVQESVNQ